MAKKTNDILKMDLYALLGTDSTATTKQIKKAYRKKAVTCHPDKNPDNPKAVELFHQLTQALEVLTDAASKAAYDKICEAKKREAKRDRELDEQRKKFKLDWEAKERQAEAEKEEAEFNKRRDAEIIRLREETGKMLEEQRQKEAQRVQRIWQQAASEVKGSTSTTNQVENPVLKLKWKCKKGDETNGGYSQDMLFKRLNTFGGVLTVVISKEKKGIALVEFSNAQAAERVFNYEKGLNENPLKISWMKGEPKVAPSYTPSSSCSQDAPGSFEVLESFVLSKLRQAAELQKRTQQEQEDDKDDKEGGSATPSTFSCFPSAARVAVPPVEPPSSKQRDRESLADMEIRQAAERRRLIKEMQKEDDE